MNTKIKIFILVIIPLLFLIFYSENFVETGSISFINAVTGSESIEDVIRTGRPELNVFSEKYGLAFRLYLSGIVLMYVFSPAFLVWLKDVKKVKTKTVLKVGGVILLWFVCTMFLGYDRLGEFFCHYYYTVFYMVIFTCLVLALIELFFVKSEKVVTK